MIKFTAKLHTVSSEIHQNLVSLSEQKCEDVSLVSVDAQVGGFASYRKDMWIDPVKGIEINISLPPVERFMADYRQSQFWCAPLFSSNLLEVPNETQHLIVQLKNGEFAVFVPVVNDTYKCVIEANDENSISARVYSLADKLYECKGLVLAYAVGNDPIALTEKCVKFALSKLQSGVRTRKERIYPDIFEYLGWCSWDAMQIRVSEEGMIKKCEEFQTKNIPVKWAILDDMWATVKSFYGKTYNNFDEMVKIMHSSPIDSFEADPIRFPNGLSGAVKHIKEYDMLVGVWHPTTGYWRGIAEGSDAHKMLSSCLIKSNLGHLVASPDCVKSYLYYKTIHDFYRKSDVDFVKIDNQSTIEPHYKGMMPIGKLARNIHDGMEASVGEHFNSTCINCMGLASEDTWTRTSTPLTRCSDDFQPENRAWFAKHILQCAYNSIFQGQFYYCDWDMWWTNDEQAKKNSLVRAISGGPIYVSDQLDKSVSEILKPLALSNGRILRCDRPAMPTLDCLTVDCRYSKTAMKIQNLVGEHGVMLLLNIDENNEKVSTTISANQISGFNADEYVLYEHFTKEYHVLKKDESLSVSLQNNDSVALYTLAPIKNGFAVIGRSDKFISPATISHVKDQTVILKEDGPYVIYKDGKLIHKNSAQ